MTTYQVQEGRATTTSENAILPSKTSTPSNARSERNAFLGPLIGGVAVLISGLGLFIGTLCTYGIRDGLVVMLVFGLATSLLAQLGHIPVIGPIGYAVVSRLYVMPVLFRWFPSIHPSWITEVQFWFGLLTAILLTGSSILAIRSKPTK